jgi:hypothetical protein
MLGERIAIALLIFALSGCAQEKHPASPSPTRSGETLHEVGSDCSVRFKNSKLCISYAWEKVPTETEEGSFIFKTYRPNLVDQSPVLVALPETPNVVLWMTSMGHGSSPVTVETVDTGTYRANHVFFVMPGNWEIRFQQKAQETVNDEAVASYTY